ncbi:sensor histidine kinase [Fusibacter ferrireducens]|uniref:histidine kinase n=1 Tax=Fusibacter ferrireducens TaxID=2785058 RepID=A0ABR9ZP27_9FIRM|nr:HAMP domain-containing sensor histidine kinase [Fusibacter ferrireducens]MBF4692169.1 HAMP domain-containing protein [Fusibacter ferrireducens]
MKLDIENRILIPFMLFTILPICFLAGVSYWNGHHLLMNEKKQSLEMTVQESLAFIDSMAKEMEQSDPVDETKEKVLEFFSTFNTRDIVILEDGMPLLNQPHLEIDALKSIRSNKTSGIYDGKDLLMVYDYYERWQWLLVTVVDKSNLLDNLIDIQKYILLISIMFLILSMQAIIFTAHSISKPIRSFAEFCKTIDFDNLDQKIDVHRSDEIGVLAKAFNAMIDQLNASAESLIEMKRYSEDILQNASVGILTTDALGHPITMNRAGTDILNKYDHNANILDALNQHIDKAVHSRKGLDTTISLSEVTNKTLYFDVSISLLQQKNDEFVGIICCFNDITKRRILENNIIRVNRLASVGQFAAGMAHEIRNPLTGLKTGIQYIRTQLPKSDITGIELTDDMVYEINRINNLVSELLDFSKPKHAFKEQVNLQLLLKKSLDILDDELRKKHVNLRILESDQEPIGIIDKDQIEQVFINIIKNAVNALDDYGNLTIQIKVLELYDPSWIKLSFIDTGHGIPPENFERIFDPFFTTKPKGIGLGLSVVNSLLIQNEGKMEIESKHQVGTTVHIYLPRYKGVSYEN